MANHYPRVLLAGYADDIELVAATLVGYDGELILVREDVIELADEWRSAVACYVFSSATAFSSQLKALFTALHWRRQAPQLEVAVLLVDASVDSVFPELGNVKRIHIGHLPGYLGR